MEKIIQEREEALKQTEQTNDSTQLDMNIEKKN
jgi:hypothetical protein